MIRMLPHAKRLENGHWKIIKLSTGELFTPFPETAEKDLGFNSLSTDYNVHITTRCKIAMKFFTNGPKVAFSCKGAIDSPS